MPFFNWNAPTAAEVVGNHFWVYWAVTGPLTLFTVVLVGMWVMVRNSKPSLLNLRRYIIR
jgi:hypothetical protein